MANKETTAYKKGIALLLANKWDRPYSKMVGYVCCIMGMVIIRSKTMMLRGARSKRREVPGLEDMAACEAVRERNLEW